MRWGERDDMKEKISNISLLKQIRKNLRKQATPQEVILWSRLKNGRLGYKFRRQHSFGKYIADFYCREKAFIIELDGSQHLEQKEYDNERSRFFKKRGLRVLRFWNNEVNINIEGVTTRIIEALEK